MKKSYLLLFFLFSLISFSQSENIYATCGSDFLIENQNNYDPSFEEYYQNQIISKQKNPATYYIPVVFHVIHTGEALGVESNVSDLTIYEAIKSLNNHFNNNHKDPNSSNSKIQFVLATKDPNGNCSTGINRINYGSNQTYVQYGNQYSSANNGVSANSIRALSSWNPTKYYNIWVVNKITSSTTVSAYAYLSASHGTTHDGTVISYPYLQPHETTLAHEIGHSLNLHHTFQGSTGTNCPTQQNGCGADGDCVADTPPHPQRHTVDLNLTAFNSCTNNNNSSFKNNYMCYTQASYRTAFTPLQIARMQSAINFYRSSYLPANNTVFSITTPPVVEFYVNESKTNYKQFYCVGTPINLLNTSTCFINTFNKTTVSNFSALWEIKRNNQTILTSTEPNPTITLTQPGTYSITLTATNAAGKRSLTKNNILEIIQPKNTISYCANKSANTGYFGYSINKVSLNAIKNATPTQITEGYKNFSCSHITQVSSTAKSNIDVWITNNNSSNSTTNLNLHGYIDYNQNGTFELNELAFSQVVPPKTSNVKYSLSFTPPSTVKIGEIVRMRVVSELNTLNLSKVNCTTNFYVGDIEDYSLIFVPNLGTEDVLQTNFKLYPNPVTNVLNIESTDTSLKNIQLFDISGKLLKTLKEDKSNFTIDTSNLTPAAYILKINNVSYTFIKK